MNEPVGQLVSYIAPAAPATRRPARGGEPFLRPEMGFTPKWYHDAMVIDFGQRWHCDPAHRLQTVTAMRRELDRRFEGMRVGCDGRFDGPPDVLTGTFGACCVAAIYGVPILYGPDKWPNCEPRYLTAEQAARLEPPDLDANPFFCEVMRQVEWIARKCGQVDGYLNWQGVLNNAYRLRGEDLFADMVVEPDRARLLFECVTSTMIAGAGRLYERQRQSGVRVCHFTVSNCMVNMISPRHYHDLLLPFDRRVAETFGLIGIHNCAWNADPYVEHYASVPNVGYVDMGLDSDLAAARRAFPNARRAVMYTPMDLVNKDPDRIRGDLQRIADDCGPCDVVFADIETGTPDERVRDVVELCREISEKTN